MSVTPTSGAPTGDVSSVSRATVPTGGQPSSIDISFPPTGDAPTARRPNVHFRSTKGDWRTPRVFYERLQDEFSFDLDVAADCENRLTGYRDPGWDALAPDAEWGRSNYINPPYGRTVGQWIAAAIRHANAESIQTPNGSTVVMLLPARTDTDWWHTLILRHADEVRLLRGRLRFSDSQTGAPFPSCVVVFRPMPRYRGYGPKFSSFHWR